MGIKMRKILHKWFWAWDFDKEEKWLNEMSAKGFSLIAVGFCTYAFKESLPGEYDFRLELLEYMPKNVESKRYIEFVEETGAQYLGSVTRWVYFRKKKDIGEFNLYSDYNTRINHLNRILTLLTVIAILVLCMGISNIFAYVNSAYIIVVNLVVGIFLVGFGLLILYGFLRINSKKRRLKKEKQLFE